MKHEKLIKTGISTLLQLAFIPLLHFLIYHIALRFHTPVARHGYGFYGLTIFYLKWFVIVSLPLLNLLFVYVIKKTRIAVAIHFLWLVLIVWFTKADLAYYPYQHALVLFCTASSIFSRLIFNKIVRLKDGL
ncbi:MAG: hypothetical protein R3A43_01785 [Bacteroidia bacterium]